VGTQGPGIDGVRRVGAAGRAPGLGGRGQRLGVASPDVMDHSTSVAAFLDRRRSELGRSSPAVATLQRLCDLYGNAGLLPDGQDRPLHEVCSMRHGCWSGCSPPDDAERRTHQGVSAPWIGSDYAEHGVCVVGLNFDLWGGLDAHWDICRSHIEGLERGLKGGKAGLFFAYGAMTYAALLLESLTGEAFEDWVDPDARRLAATWSACAFLEAVKCSPAPSPGNPSKAMVGNCPRLLLRAELEILRPRVVLLLGRTTVRDVVRPMLDVAWGEHPDGLERDTFKLADGTVVDVISANHPSGSNRAAWRRSVQSLHLSLDEPLCSHARAEGN
jgi:hypothetical protein